MNKSAALNQVITHLAQELNTLLGAAEQAHLAAIDDQSIAETQYDTLAIEAGYLAEGQSKRAQEIQTALTQIKQLKLTSYQEGKSITLGDMVLLDSDEKTQDWFFLLPAAGGYKGEIAQAHFTVVTPQSPMGKALIGKLCDDEISVEVGRNLREDEIIRVI